MDLTDKVDALILAGEEKIMSEYSEKLERAKGNFRLLIEKE